MKSKKRIRQCTKSALLLCERGGKTGCAGVTKGKTQKSDVAVEREKKRYIEEERG